MMTPPRNLSESGLLTLADYASQAQTRLAPEAWAYFEGGAADELTIAANQTAWRRWWLQPRVLTPQAGGHSRVTLLGRTLEWPALLAPIAHQRWAHPEGEIGSAVAASALGAGLVLSTLSNTPMDQVLQAYRSAPAQGLAAFQLYLQADPEATLGLVRCAEDSGYDALVVTVDAPVQGVRDRERRQGVQLPPGLQAVHSPTAGRLTLDQLRRQAPTWDDVQWLTRQTHLPILLKGILHPDDARQALALGIAGIIVSNHGGRTLDTALPTAAALPAIRSAVGPKATVVVDGGIRRGTDIVKALALGADAVLLGRPYIHGLACAGAQGAAAVLRLLRDEFEAAQVLCGCVTSADIRRECLFAPEAMAGAATISA